MSNYQGLKTYRDDQIVYDQLSLICEYLGRSNAARLLIDELLTNDLVYVQQKQNQNEVMFLINLILRGVSMSKNIADLNSIVNLVLNTFLNEFKQEKMPTIDTLKSTLIKNREILQTCLVLESILISSKCLPAKDYSRFLIDTLYFTLENYLNTNLLIRVVSTASLNGLAANLGYKNIQDMLSTNYDYIMNDLILKSNAQSRAIVSARSKQDSSIQASHVFVLCALLEISNSDLVPYLERLIDDYFFSIELNNSDYQIMMGICRIMLTMSRSMRKWYPIKLNFLDTSKYVI